MLSLTIYVELESEHLGGRDAGRGGSTLVNVLVIQHRDEPSSRPTERQRLRKRN